MVKQEPVKGVYGYKPPHSDNENEYYIFDFMGMIGVPLLPTSVYPENAEVIFLPSQAATDKNLIERIKNSVSNGKTIIVTPGLIKAVENNEQLLKLAGLQSVEYESQLQVKNLIWENKKIPLQEPIFLPAKLNATNAQQLLVGENGKNGLPFLIKKEHPSGGQVFVINVNTFSEGDFKVINEVLLAPKPIPWLDFPAEWLNVIRGVFLDPLKISFKGEGRVSLHLFDNNNIVVCNFNDKTVEVDLNLKNYLKKTEKQILINKLNGDTLRTKSGKIKLIVDKRIFNWVGN